MPSNPDISVIIPVYNPGPHFDECIESVLSQVGCSLEAIFVDDGSTDDSPAILDELAQGDSRIRVFHQENQGAGPARNLGIEHAAGEYIAFMDSDDYYPTDHALSDLLTAARDKDATICGGSMVLTKPGNGTFIDAFADDELYVFDHEGWRNYADDQMDYGYTRYITEKTYLKMQPCVSQLDVGMRTPSSSCPRCTKPSVTTCCRMQHTFTASHTSRPTGPHASPATY